MNEQYAITFETIIRVKELSLSKQDRTEEIQDLLTARPFDYNALKAQERERVLKKVVKILAAHTINSDDFKQDHINEGWVLVGGYEPILEEIESLRSESRECPR